MARSPDANWTNPSFTAKRILRKPTVPLQDYSDSGLADAHRAKLREKSLAARSSSDHDICFVFGVMPRSGTNYLERLLEAHNDIATCPSDLRELPFLAAVDAMETFRADLGRFYEPNLDVFIKHEWLAYAMAGYVNSIRAEADEGKVLTVIKDPHMRNIALFDALMPTEKAILVLRDGRYVIDSTIRTWPLKPLGRTFEDVCLEWNAATEAALSFGEKADKDQVRIVRYEDAVADTGAQMNDLFGWLGLDPARSDQSRITDAPILGSSTHSKDASGEVGWTPVKSKTGFDPTNRPLDWTDSQRETFVRVCADTQKKAGYNADFS